jgi:hypothetical protein
VIDPDDREMLMSCGAALAHLTVTLRRFGYAGEVTAFPDPGERDLLATVRLGRAHTPGPGDHQLFEAIDNRHTHRAAFESRSIPDEVLAQLGRDAHRAGATLRVFTGDQDPAAIATLIGEGDRAQFNDANFRRELAAWIRPNRTRQPDGMPDYAFALRDRAAGRGEPAGKRVAIAAHFRNRASLPATSGGACQGIGPVLRRKEASLPDTTRVPGGGVCETTQEFGSHRGKYLALRPAADNWRTAADVESSRTQGTRTGTP